GRDCTRPPVSPVDPSHSAVGPHLRHHVGHHHQKMAGPESHAGWAGSLFSSVGWVGTLREEDCLGPVLICSFWRGDGCAHATISTRIAAAPRFLCPDPHPFWSLSWAYEGPN